MSRKALSVTRRVATIGAGAALLAAGARAPEDNTPIIAPGIGPEVSELRLRSDGGGRLTAPVQVDGKGPFRFIVDTGANRSVLSRRVAESLALTPIGERDVHAVTGVERAECVRVQSLHSGAFVLQDAVLPVLGESVLGAADGMLGADGLSNRRLVIDNRRRLLTIERSSDQLAGAHWRSAAVKFRFGNLTTGHAAMGDLKIPIVFDTGADFCLATPSLRNVLSRENWRSPSTGTRILSASDVVIEGDAMKLPKITIAGLDFHDVGALVADLHVFHLWELNDIPAIIAGMNMLSVVSGFALDYGRREVLMRL